MSLRELESQQKRLSISARSNRICKQHHKWMTEYNKTATISGGWFDWDVYCGSFNFCC